MSRSWSSNALFYRQVHPSFCTDGKPMSSAFNPTPKDSDLLSVDDAALISAQGAWDQFTGNLGLKSAGTWAVGFSEIMVPPGLSVLTAEIKDQSEASKNNAAHCVVDFTALTTKGQRKHHAQRLALKATERGRQFP